jgi:pimeloyl-ACP methyl ester carboxylesterase
MYIEEHGAADGTPVMFLHGAMVAGWMWHGQVEALTTYRCLLPDFPGMGQSANEQWIGFADTADRIADEIRARCVDSSTHLVGLSLGGIIGLNVAVRHPDTVRSLVISGVPHGSVPLILRMFSRVMAGLYSRSWGAGLIAEMLGIPRDESREAFVQTARQTNPAALQAATEEVNRAPLPSGLERVMVPTLAVVGAKDTKPAQVAVPFLCKVMPNAVGYSVPDVGHQWNAEQPELFSEMVRMWVDSRSVIDQLARIY